MKESGQISRLAFTTQWMHRETHAHKDSSMLSSSKVQKSQTTPLPTAGYQFLVAYRPLQTTADLFSGQLILYNAPRNATTDYSRYLRRMPDRHAMILARPCMHDSVDGLDEPSLFLDLRHGENNISSISAGPSWIVTVSHGHSKHGRHNTKPDFARHSQYSMESAEDMDTGPFMQFVLSSTIDETPRT